MNKCIVQGRTWQRQTLVWAFFFFLILVCEATGTAATPGLLCQPRVIVKMIVERQMECKLAGETEVLGENLHQRNFCPSQIPHDQTRVWTWYELTGIRPCHSSGVFFYLNFGDHNIHKRKLFFTRSTNNYRSFLTINRIIIPKHTVPQHEPVNVSTSWHYASSLRWGMTCFLLRQGIL
jgi:hypothetical protein